MNAVEHLRLAVALMPVRAIAWFLILLGLLVYLAGCAPRHCRLLEVVPTTSGGARVLCDGEPWGDGTTFRDVRKCRK